MGYNEKLFNKIKKALGHLADVEEKKMFSGITFMVDGKMCISVGKDRIMCRIDPAIHDDALKKKGVKTVKMGGREYRGYVYVNEDALKSRKEFDYWVSLALDFNKRAKASKKKKK